MIALLCAALSAALLILIFPGFNFTFLAPLALVPLLWELNRKPRIWVGYTTGFLFWFGVCYWIQFTLVNHGGTGESLGWALFILFCLAKAIQMALFAWLAGMALQTRWAVPAVAALWTLLEWTHQYTGFTWLLLGNAAVDWPILPRLAPWTGVYGISFMLALIAATLVKRQWPWLSLLIVPFLLPALPPPTPGKAAALIVQPNIPEEEQWTPDSLARTDLRLKELSKPLNTAKQLDFIVWPEVPAPIYDTDAGLPGIARAAHAHFLAGVVSRTPDGSPLNSAILFSADGAFVSKYDKVHLVPFGEFVPWPFDLVTRKISAETGDFRAGTRVVVADRAGTFICYESVFPNYIRQFASGGAQVLFNISNDGWFGKSAARFQHLEIARMRAIENRRWIIRVTNDGISATIDPAGRITAESQLYREAAGTMGFNFESGTTFYTRHGDWFLLVCGVVAALGFWRRSR